MGGAGGWAPCCVLGAGVGRRERFDVMHHGAGRRASVVCEVALCAQFSVFRFVLTFLYFSCLCSCARVLPVYDAINNNNIQILIVVSDIRQFHCHFTHGPVYFSFADWRFVYSKIRCLARTLPFGSYFRVRSSYKKTF